MTTCRKLNLAPERMIRNWTFGVIIIIVVGLVSLLWGSECLGQDSSYTPGWLAKEMEKSSSREFPFLNEWANSPAVINNAEFELLRMITLTNSEGYLTDDLIKIGLSAHWGNFDTCLTIIVGTSPQSHFKDHYLGNGRFDLSDRELRHVFEDAAKEIHRMFLPLFQKMSCQSDMIIEIYYRGFDVGTYYNGEFKLAGE